MYDVFEQLLQENKITAYKISKDTGISQTVFSNWKSGRNTPKQDKLKIIADYFGVTIEYLMGWCEDKANGNVEYVSEDKQYVISSLDELSAEDLKIVLYYIN